MTEINVYRIRWDQEDGDILYAGHPWDGRDLRRQLERVGFQVKGPTGVPGLLGDGGALFLLRVSKPQAGAPELRRVLGENPRVRFRDAI